MNGLDAFIVGAIQGLLEWLPVSSEAQTMLFMLSYLKMDAGNALYYAFYLHSGTMFAVIIKFRKEFVCVIKNLSLNFRLTRILFFATLSTSLPAIPLYFLLKKVSVEQSSTIFTLIIGLMLLLTGIIMYFTNSPGSKNLTDISDKDIFLVGIAQGFAILPGISRSGITVATLLARKINQETSLMISFLLSVPATICLICLDFRDVMSIPIETALILAASSFLFGYTSMDILLIFAKKVSFSIFCLILGILTVSFTIIFLL